MNAYPSGSPAVPGKPVGQIEEQFQHLTERLDAQEKTIHELNERLSALLTPMPPEPARAVTHDPPRRVLVGLAERLDTAASRVNQHNTFLSGIMERLEL